MRRTKKIFIAAAFLSACTLLCPRLTAQTTDNNGHRPADMFLLLQTFTPDGSHITIRQSTAIKEQFNSYITRNSYKKLQGFRVRIFFDNSQIARQQSLDVEMDFKNQYPDIPTYRIHQNLYFKVAVGDFRTKSDAMRFKRSIENLYPGAFIIKETINYPAL
jgi:hypothetical protein